MAFDRATRVQERNSEAFSKTLVGQILFFVVVEIILERILKAF